MIRYRLKKKVAVSAGTIKSLSGKGADGDQMDTAVDECRDTA